MKLGRNYGWYQTQFYTIAKDLYSKNVDANLVKFRYFPIHSDVEKIEKLDDVQLEKIMLDEFKTVTIEIIKWKYGS